MSCSLACEMRHSLLTPHSGFGTTGWIESQANSREITTRSPWPNWLMDVANAAKRISPFLSRELGKPTISLNECRLSSSVDWWTWSQLCFEVRHPGEVLQMVQHCSEQQNLRRETSVKQSSQKEESGGTDFSPLRKRLEGCKESYGLLLPKNQISRRPHAGHCRNCTQNGQNLLRDGKEQVCLWWDKGWTWRKGISYNENPTHAAGVGQA